MCVQCTGAVARVGREKQGAPRVKQPTTYILPDLPWAVLLAPIMRDARPGDVLEVHTDAMRQHVEQVMQEAGRTDLVIRQVEPPPQKGFA